MFNKERWQVEYWCSWNWKEKLLWNVRRRKENEITDVISWGAQSLSRYGQSFQTQGPLHDSASRLHSHTENILIVCCCVNTKPCAWVPSFLRLHAVAHLCTSPVVRHEGQNHAEKGKKNEDQWYRSKNSICVWGVSSYGCTHYFIIFSFHVRRDKTTVAERAQIVISKNM